MDRRGLLRRMGLGAAALAAKRAWPQMAGMAHPMPPGPHAARTMDASRLTPFVDALPLPEKLHPVGLGSNAALHASDADLYRVRMRAISVRLHRDLPLTRMWSYGASSAPVLIEARSGQGTLVDWVNDLPAHHILPLDAPMKDSAAMDERMMHAPPTRAVPHLHGARVPHDSDGYPEDWFGPGRHRMHYYPNQQDATALWVHDHAMGVSRLNVVAGLMGWYVLRDEVEATLPLPRGAYEVPLMIYDRSFTPAGQLYYPNPPDEGAWASEFLGDAMVVNGKVQPFLDVEPRLYRFRIVNTANSRFFALALVNGAPFHVIGSDQGLLDAPVEMTRLILAPAERTDILIDFAPHAGKHLELISDTLQLMQFRVSSAPVKDDASVPTRLRPVERLTQARASRTRLMTLNEYDGDAGEPMVMLLNRKHWAEPVTEIVKLGSTEIWSFANLTEDTHPIHLHMVRFQILDRRPFAVDDYLTDETVRYTADAVPPATHELGWKDVVQCPAGTITRIIVPFEPYAGRFLWHCHILEHEANDMMRPYDVIA